MIRTLKIFAFLLLPLVCFSALAADTPEDIPADVRWRDDFARFFFVNIGDTTSFSHAFENAAANWRSGNFHFEMTGDASNNQACKARPENIRIVNFAYFAPNWCGKSFDPNTLAVTVVQWNSITREFLAADIMFNTAFI